MTSPGISLASLDARKASETPFEFEYITPNGERSGVFLSVLGAQSPQVKAETRRLLNDRRRKEATAELKVKLAGKQAEPTVVPVEDDEEFGQRMNAARLVGWRGITDPFTPENALALIQSNSHVAQQVAEASDELGNFMKPSSKDS